MNWSSNSPDWQDSSFAAFRRDLPSLPRQVSPEARIWSVKMTDDENVTTVNAYLDAFYSGNLSRAKDLVADAFKFTGPFVQTESRDAFFASAAGLVPIVKGHRMLHQWSDRGEVCSVFEMMLQTPLKEGRIPVCERHTLAGGKLIAGRVMLKVTDFRAFMPPR